MPARGADTKTAAQTTDQPPADDAPLARKLAWVMSQVGYIQKTGWNDFHKYHYVTEADLVGAIRPLLGQMGVIIIPNVLSTARIAEVTERNGVSTLTEVDVEYTITDGLTSYVFHMPGHGLDRADKGVYKAVTGSMKYALYKLFEVETGDDPERDSVSDDAVNVSITGSSESGIGKGGRAETATRYQLQRVSATMREKGVSRETLVELIHANIGVQLVLPESEEEQGKVVLAFLKDLHSEDIGKLIAALDSLTMETNVEPAS